MSFQTLLQDSLGSTKLLELVDSSTSASDIVRALGHSVNGRRIAQTKEFMISNDIDISHWTANGRKIVYITKECPVCKVSFTKPKYNETLTCGYSCANTYFRSGTSNPNWKEGSKSYRVKALAEYGELCNRCGYSNIHALVVHHKDRNRNNNIMSNLEVLCSNCHSLEHYATEAVKI